MLPRSLKRHYRHWGDRVAVRVTALQSVDLGSIVLRVIPRTQDLFAVFSQTEGRRRINLLDPTPVCLTKVKKSRQVLFQEHNFLQYFFVLNAKWGTAIPFI